VWTLTTIIASREVRTMWREEATIVQKLKEANTTKCKKVITTLWGETITYYKGCCDRFLGSFFHHMTHPSIHGWHHTGKKTLVKINNPPSGHESLSRKGMAGPAGGGATPKILISILATNPTYILTKIYIYGFQIAFISKT